MDINDVRSLIMVLSFATFIGIVAWAYSGKRKQSFEQAALLPFSDDEPADAAWQAARKQERIAP